MSIFVDTQCIGWFFHDHVTIHGRDLFTTMFVPTQVQVFIDDRRKGHMESPKITKSFILIILGWRDVDMGIVSLYLSHQDVSTDV